MTLILRNILAVIVGFVGGSFVNMGVLELGPLLISNPVGFDNSTMEALAETIHLLEPQNYITVFLAHGLGTLIGAALASLIAGSNKIIFASIVGVLFLAAGIYMSFLIQSPIWYSMVDSIGAYLPMAWVGWKLTGGKK